ncbi:MAG: DUF2214 domain-containing protein [Hyphomicrobiales bacterium]|nr:DUF2214 domain-containing protein [Hyphomicrobiales bacterium]
MLTEWLTALHDWDVAALVRRSVYIYPFVNAGHIFSLTLLIGGILPADLRLLGLFQGVAAGPFIRLMTAISATGLTFAIATGFFLFSVQPLEYAGNPAFLTKISLVALGAIHALAIRFTPAWRTAITGGNVAPGLKFSAALSMAIWITALLAGRWIAFL